MKIVRVSKAIVATTSKVCAKGGYMFPQFPQTNPSRGGSVLEKQEEDVRRCVVRIWSTFPRQELQRVQHPTHADLLDPVVVTIKLSRHLTD